MSEAAKNDRKLALLWQEATSSPSWERDAAAITSPWRMGLWFLVLNGLIVFGLIMVHAMFSDLSIYDELTPVIARMGLGRLFCGALFLSLSFFLSIFVPIRVFGVIFSPRLGRYFDQIVLSGITPWRFIGGKIVGQQAFYLIVLAVCLPYLVFCISFGGISFTEVALYTAMIFVYVHVLVIISLAASMMMSEILALPLVIIVFTLSAVIGLMPLSPHPLNLTPTASIMAVLYEAVAAAQGEETTMTGLFVGGFPGLTLFQSHLLLFALISFALLALGGLAVTLGPINSLARGLNTFGEAVLPGDRKRAGWLKRRFNLRRQSELSFLYENNAPAWRAADFRRRWFLRETVFILLIGAALIWLYWLFASGHHTEAFYPLHFVLAMAALFLNALMFSENWATERLTVGRWEAGRLNVFCFAANSVLVWSGFAWAPSYWEMDLPQLSWTNNEAFGHIDIQVRHSIAAGIFSLAGFAFYALMRNPLLRGYSKFTAFLFALSWMALISAASSWTATGLELLLNANRPVEDPLKLTWLTMGNPITAANAVMSDGMILSENEGQWGVLWCALLYTVVGILALLVARRRRRRLPLRAL